MVNESNTPVAGPSSLPFTDASKKPKSRRKRSVVETSEPSSSTSTPKLTKNEDEPRLKSKKQKSKVKDKLKKRRNDIVEAVEIVASNASFDSAADFIALWDSDEDEKSAPARDEKGKRQKNKDDGVQESGQRSKRKRSRSRSLERRDDRGKDRKRDRDRDRKQKGREWTPEREWDRGKRREQDRDRRRYEQPISASVRSVGNRKLPWLEGLDLFGCHNVAELLHKEVEAFTRWISPSPVEDEIRCLLVAQITSAITYRFRDAEIYPFGSYATKLYLPTGDIDLVVISETMRMTDKHVILRSLAEVIKRNSIASNVSIIAKARVPIIKFVTTHGHIPVDVSINQSNGTVGADVINGFLRDMFTSTTVSHLEGSIALRALVMFTKMFLSQRSMNEVYTGGLGSYSIVSLVISFLQMHPKIRRGEIDADQNLGVLLLEFFELYGSFFNYENVGISVRDGGTYFNKRQRGWYNDSSNYKGKGGASSLSIEDPIDITNDISSGSYGFSKVRATFAGAHQILTATAYLKAGILSARKSNRSTSLRSEEYCRPEEMSILSHVIDITQDVINHRRVVQEVYDRRVLHNLLNVKPRIIVVEDKLWTKPPSLSPSRHASASNSHVTAPAESALGTANKNPINLEEGEIPIVISSEAEGDQHPFANGDDDDDDDDDHNHHPHRRRREESNSEDESGKYGISGRQPPKKRLKTGGPTDVHTVVTVYTTDEDDDDEKGNDDTSLESELDSVAAEEVEYDIDGNDIIGIDTMETDMHEDMGNDSRRSKDGGNTDVSELGKTGNKADNKPLSNGGNGKKRSYWLSKGIVPGGVDVGADPESK
ncbi:hypothetical protein GGU10DRAFT_366944 [Lentinula aff. detonsa]|uniref:polynucleotide adenylyltransferase n=1 Tax=Lentinula aff. detonsa TaxID=2804958 RepID=A0AA38KU11_9AGAR|nr:hypothetical protein GGU10DRAFT_366944 [Lentinula aff. detonsa]